MGLIVVPSTLEEANAFVLKHHRHHRPTPVAKFSMAAASGSLIVGVVIVGLPKARLAMDGWTLEVTRLATDGTRNACSLLYGAARRATFALGYTRLLTYTLAEEDGASLRAAGFVLEDTIKGESWMRRSEHGGWFVDDRNPVGDKKRWNSGKARDSVVPHVEVPTDDCGQDVLAFGEPESEDAVGQR